MGSVPRLLLALLLPAVLLAPLGAGVGVTAPHPLQFVQAAGVLDVAVPNCTQTSDVQVRALFDGPTPVFLEVEYAVGDVVERLDLAAVGAEAAFAGHGILCATAGVAHLDAVHLDCALGVLELHFVVDAHTAWNGVQDEMAFVAAQLAPPAAGLRFQATGMVPCWENVAAGLEPSAPGGTPVLGLACLRDTALWVDVDGDGQADLRDPVKTVEPGSC